MLFNHRSGGAQRGGSYNWRYFSLCWWILLPLVFYGEHSPLNTTYQMNSVVKPGSLGDATALWPQELRMADNLMEEGFRKEDTHSILQSIKSLVSQSIGEFGFDRIGLSVAIPGSCQNSVGFAEAPIYESVITSYLPWQPRSAKSNMPIPTGGFRILEHSFNGDASRVFTPARRSGEEVLSRTTNFAASTLSNLLDEVKTQDYDGPLHRVFPNISTLVSEMDYRRKMDSRILNFDYRSPSSTILGDTMDRATDITSRLRTIDLLSLPPSVTGERIDTHLLLDLIDLSRIPSGLSSATRFIRPELLDFLSSNGVFQNVLANYIGSPTIDRQIILELGEVAQLFLAPEAEPTISFERSSTFSSVSEWLYNRGYPTLKRVCTELGSHDVQVLADPSLIITSLCNSEPLDVTDINALRQQCSNRTTKGIAVLEMEAYSSYLASNPALESLRYLPAHMPINHEFISSGGWPLPHRSGYAQGSSSLPSLDGTSPLTHDFLNWIFITSNPITLLYTSDNKYVWGSSWTSIFKVDRSRERLVITDYVSKQPAEWMNDKFHGAYSVLTAQGVFVTARLNRLEAFQDVPGTDGRRIMQLRHSYNLHEDIPSARPDESIFALCILGDGSIAWTTTAGRIGVASSWMGESFTRALDSINLASELSVSLEISNGIACDGNDIYIVSSRYLHKLVWDGTKLQVTWNTAYGRGHEGQLSVRLGEGSGSTPAIMGSDDNKYIVITDDAEIMAVNVFDASTGALVAKKGVTFGDPHATKTLSEQSILINGWRMVIVNNSPTESALSDAVFRVVGAPFLLASPFIPSLDDFNKMITSAWPVITGDAPKGAEQMVFDPETKSLSVTWVNKDVSIPNGIPTMSAATGLMYGIGKRSAYGFDAAPFRGMWTLEALDWWTGETRFHYNIGIGPFTNTIYAATQVGPDEIITGTVGGIVRIKAQEVH